MTGFPPSLYGVPCATLRIATVSPHAVFACGAVVLGTTTRRQDPVCVAAVLDHDNVFLSLVPLPPAAAPVPPPGDDTSARFFEGAGSQRLGQHTFVSRRAPACVVRLPLGVWLPESVALAASDCAGPHMLVAVVVARDRRAAFLRAVGIAVVEVTQVDSNTAAVHARGDTGAPSSLDSRGGLEGPAFALRVLTMDWFPLEEVSLQKRFERRCAQIHAQLLPVDATITTTTQPSHARLLVTSLDSVTCLACSAAPSTATTSTTTAAETAPEQRTRISVLNFLMEPQRHGRYSVASQGKAVSLAFNEAVSLGRNHYWTTSSSATTTKAKEDSAVIASSTTCGDPTTSTWHSHVLLHETVAGAESPRFNIFRLDLVLLPRCGASSRDRQLQLILSSTADIHRSPLHLTAAATLLRNTEPTSRRVTFASFPELPAALVVVEEESLTMECKAAKRMRHDEYRESETVRDDVCSGCPATTTTTMMAGHRSVTSGALHILCGVDDSDSGALRPNRASESVRIALPQLLAVRDVGIVPAKTIGGHHLVAALLHRAGAQHSSNSALDDEDLRSPWSTPPPSLLVWQSPFVEWTSNGPATTWCSRAVPYELRSSLRLKDGEQRVLDACMAHHAVGSSVAPPWLGTVVVVELVLASAQI